jgi:uncharacterized membrane protein YqaE (UPF0057 family)
MKKYSLLTFLAVSLFFVGCTMEKRHYNSGYHVEWLSQKGKVQKAEPAAQQEKEMDQQLALQEETVVMEQEQATVAPVVVAEVVAPVVTDKAETPAKKETSNKIVRQEVRKEMKAAQKEMKSIEKGFTADASVATLDQASSSPLSDVDVILLVILAIILPPLAVGLHRGIGTEFWISLLLTILFWIPGVIYAILVVLDVV